MNNWQPIETAPKENETKILIYDSFSKGQYVVFWGQSDTPHWKTREYNHCWVLDSSRSREIHDFTGEPTYWVPLPKTPIDIV